MLAHLFVFKAATMKYLWLLALTLLAAVVICSAEEKIEEGMFSSYFQTYLGNQ
mgnify:CR=1 FL=1